jgi:hypothetical protein
LRKFSQASVKFALPWISSPLELPVAILVVLAVYAAGVIFMYWLDRIVLDISYHVFALAFTYWFLGTLRYGVRAKHA